MLKVRKRREGVVSVKGVTRKTGGREISVFSTTRRRRGLGVCGGSSLEEDD